MALSKPSSRATPIRQNRLQGYMFEMPSRHGSNFTPINSEPFYGTLS
jgi:hypothetical protein